MSFFNEIIMVKKLILNKIFISLIVFFGCHVSNLNAQCSSSLTVETATIPTENKGAITVNVNTNGDFICELNIEKGTGPEKVEEKRGKNKSTVIFESLETSNIYQIRVTFFAEEKEHCKQLQKSGLTFEAD